MKGFNAFVQLFMPKDKVFYSLFEEVADSVARMGDLLKEVVSGVYPTQVINQLDPLMPIAMVKVLGVPQEATSQDLHNALVHYGSIWSVRLIPTASGAGSVGYVVFHTKLAGKAATDAGYSFLGKEQVRIIHPTVTKEIEGSSTHF